MRVERERVGASLVLLAFPVMHAGMCTASAMRLDQRWLSYTALRVLAWTQWAVLVAGVVLWGLPAIWRELRAAWARNDSLFARITAGLCGAALVGHGVHALARHIQYVVAVPSYVGALVDDLAHPAAVILYAIGLSAICSQLLRALRALREPADGSSPEASMVPDGPLVITSVLWVLWAFALVRTARGL